jgi:uncharacterized membrane protein HdeD (DUF308 family)
LLAQIAPRCVKKIRLMNINHNKVNTEPKLGVVRSIFLYAGILITIAGIILYYFSKIPPPTESNLPDSVIQEMQNASRNWTLFWTGIVLIIAGLVTLFGSLLTRSSKNADQ